MRNLITDVAGVKVGSAQDAALASGVTALIFDAPAAASIAISGGAPGLRDAALLEPDMSVQKVDALVLSGGSAFGLDSMGGVQGFLREQGRGLLIGDQRVPLAPGAILFDLLNGGDKGWLGQPPYWSLGYSAAQAATLDFDLGAFGAGYGATLADLKGGLGSASCVTEDGFVVGALVAVNAVGQATIGDSRHFWAAPYERDGEFGGAEPGQRQYIRFPVAAAGRSGEDHIAIHRRMHRPQGAGHAILRHDRHAPGLRLG